MVSATCGITVFLRAGKHVLADLISKKMINEDSVLSTLQTAARVVVCGLPEYRFVLASFLCVAVQPVANLLSPLVAAKAVNLVANKSNWEQGEITPEIKFNLMIFLSCIVALEICKSTAAYFGDLLKDVSGRRILTLAQVIGFEFNC